ncbi:MAG: glycoside hydrolase family 55 protein [Eubacterium sp.]|nr:glycoside hydrolase family 55 protein [Eubacterium sp.]
MTFVNVKQSKRVKADGVSDDTKALQACIDRAKNGGTVYFPDGVYLVSATLIFYSNQTLRFSDNAVILRSDKSETVTRYLLASYSEPDWAGYSGTHDVIISGGIFDGNEKLTERSTLINTVHCNNILIENCRFTHCALWHCIEINSTKNATVRGCFFDGESYTVLCDKHRNELLQLDCSLEGSYGPVYDYNGRLIDFCKDATPCCDIEIYSYIFKCSGSPGVGHHGNSAHNNITIRNNIFDGPSGRDGYSRGYIIFQPDAYGIRVIDNAFIAPSNPSSPSLGIIYENPDKKALSAEGNRFTGHFDERIINRLYEEIL